MLNIIYWGENLLIYTCKCDETSCYYYCTTNEPEDYYYFVDIKLQEGTAHLCMSFEFGDQFVCMIFIQLITVIGLFIGAIHAIAILEGKIRRKINNRRKS